MVLKLLVGLFHVYLLCCSYGFWAVGGVLTSRKLNSNASGLFGIELPDYSSFNAVDSSANSGCNDFSETQRTASLNSGSKEGSNVNHKEFHHDDDDDDDEDVSNGSENQNKPTVKLHLKHRSDGEDTKSKKDSVLESTFRDMIRIQTLHKRIVEKKNQNSISRQSRRNLKQVVSTPVAASPESNEFSGHLTATLQSGVSLGSGEYFMDVFVGTPPKHYSLILDTGSDLNWIQCVPCYDCFEQNGSFYDPKDSTTFRNISCHDPRCQLVSSPDPPQPCKSENQTCPYYYWYGDSSNTTGDFALETFTVNLTNPSSGKSEFKTVENVMFGCGHWNRGLFHGAAGLLGLGRGPLSFSSQLQSLYGHSFSYCLVDRNSDSSVTSKLIFGEDEDLLSHPDLNFTALVSAGKKEDSTNQVDTFYYVQIKSILVDNEALNIPEDTFKLSPEGAGGTIIDSGTTLSYFADPAYKIIKDAFIKKIKKYQLIEDFPILAPCYNVSVIDQNLDLPSFGIQFSDGATWNFPVENYFIKLVPEEVVCLAILGTPSSGLSIIGNYQQQNFHILYDTRQSRLGYAPTKCSEM
ncbi:OLC1v1024393C1 [Oldenlandia corymbosa var. corymbosa]|uniref:OLC1v1024393C1 n=1 Tax=Oldenlandia corymbosa var. corymbosa TaxID=529605 RepID=A0AAV1C4I4_OLDCO|nr:OLC1v1024393C1 [Oldenlandia corymbosa var. corymbosa]